MRTRLSVFLAAMLMLSVAAGRVSAGQKLIMGFEENEIYDKMQGRTCYTFVQKATDGIDFCAPFEYGAGDLAWTWHCRSGETTEGKLALAASVIRRRPPARGFQSTPIIDRYYPVMRGNSEAGLVMSTFQWLARSGMDVGDWKGFDLLRIDVRPEGPVNLMLTVEDDLIEPPVVANYQVPGGKWSTLELDLREAVKERGLDLGKIANIYILGWADQNTALRVDNVRVVTADVAATLEVLRDPTSMKLPDMPLPDKPVVPQLPADVKPDRSPIKLEPVRTVDRTTVVPFGFVAAYDNQRLILGTNFNGRAAVQASTDGGVTWQAVVSPIVANLDHGTARGSVVDQTGDALVVSSGPGCAGVGIASPRQYVTKYTFNGQGWDYRRPPSILDSDIRHCGSNDYAIRLTQGAHVGRLWAVWGEVDRFRSLVVHAKFSDDDGVTWNLPGKGAYVPGSRESYFTYNTYGYQQPRCTPWNDGIAVFWQDEQGLRWNRFDGKQWGQMQVIDADATPLLAPTENESFRVPGSCVTVGKDEIYLTAWKIPGVLHWDGRQWKRELPEAVDAGMLTVCGGKDVMLFTAGSTEQPPAYKRVAITKQAPVLCYRRQADGSWAKPLDLSGGPTTILEYRQMTALIVPPCSPPNFAPVAWSDRLTTTFTRVPVLGN